LQTATGETVEVAQQIQLYAPNGLLKHPLVSPALSYLGDLPPLLFIAGDREVLRDEIIYTCVLLPSTFWFVVTHPPSSP
jgi:acetyl esterase/lipase